MGVFLRTISHLKPSQIFYRGFYIGFRQHLLRKRTYPLFASRRNVTTIPVFPHSTVHTDGKTFDFLNQRFTFEGDVDWKSDGMPRLWRMHLNYFDYINHADTSSDMVQQRIREWIRNCPPNSSDAWSSYALSMRVVNWMKAAWRNPSLSEQIEDFDLSLFQQLEILNRLLEWDVLANHLLKNALALLLGGIYFEGPQARRWFAKGLRVFISQMEEQVMEDGGHFERSPMYHAVVLEDCLDAIYALTSFDLEPNAVEILAHHARKMTYWLDAMCHPDGEVSFFNDSVQGQVRPSRLKSFASSLISGLQTELGLPTQFHRSGFLIFGDSANRLILDVGDPGPSYQPGHAHCDLLSFEWSLRGNRICVNSGVFEYERTSIRHWCRSTAAHNTVEVDGTDQSEIWGSFRVGRLAKPLKVTHSENCDTYVVYASHSGFSHLPDSPIHERRFDIDKSLSHIRVSDTVTGRRNSNNHEMRSFVHFHPSCQVVSCHDGIVEIRHSTVNLRIYIVNGNVDMTETPYFPQFGRRETKQTLVIRSSGSLPLNTEYHISVLSELSDTTD